MQTIGQIITQGDQAQRTTSEPSRTEQWNRYEDAYQAKPIGSSNDFLKAFPSEEKLIRIFCPSYWSYFMERKAQCMISPCITLKEVAKCYGKIDLAATLVQNNVTGIYKVSTAKDEAGQKALDGIRLGSQMFVSKHGAQCTIYAMMIYFASYIADYKSNYAAFDMQDIIKQFSKFLQIWNGNVDRALKEKDKESKERARVLEPVGNKALRIYIRDCLWSDYDIRTGYLYRKGIVTDEMIAEEEEYIKSGMF